jgi:uncharacterized membrane protein YcgQ (UPF0703/DUF1980 family)
LHCIRVMRLMTWVSRYISMRSSALAFHIAFTLLLLKLLQSYLTTRNRKRVFVLYIRYFRLNMILVSNYDAWVARISVMKLARSFPSLSGLIQQQYETSQAYDQT